MHTDDEELIKLFKRLTIGIIIIIFFSLLFVMVIANKFYPGDSKLIKDIKNSKTMYILFDDNSCTNCAKIKEKIESQNIKYYEINIDRNNEYLNILSTLNISEDEISTPTLIFIKKGQFSSSLVEIKDTSTIEVFIDDNKNID